MNIIKNIATELKKYLAQDEIIWRTNRYGQHYPIDTEALRRRGNATTGENLSAVEMLDKGVKKTPMFKSKGIKIDLGNGTVEVAKSWSLTEANKPVAPHSSVDASYKSYIPPSDLKKFALDKARVKTFINDLKTHKYGHDERRQMVSEMSVALRNNLEEIMKTEDTASFKKKALEKFGNNLNELKNNLRDIADEARKNAGSSIPHRNTEEQNQNRRAMRIAFDIEEAIGFAERRKFLCENALSFNVDKSLDKVSATLFESALKKADPDALKLFEKGRPFLAVISNTNPFASFSQGSGGIKFDASVADKGNYASTPFQTMLHESGHAIDFFFANGMPKGEYNEPGQFRSNSISGALSNQFSRTFENGAFGQALYDDVRTLIDREHKNCAKILKESKNSFNITQEDEENLKSYGLTKNDAYIQHLKNALTDSGVRDGEALEIAKSYAEKRRVTDKSADKYVIGKIAGPSNVDVSFSDLSDILHGQTDGRVCINGHGHHSEGYWDTETKPAEAFAEFFSTYMVNPEGRANLEKHLPRSTKVFKRMLKHLVG